MNPDRLPRWIGWGVSFAAAAVLWGFLLGVIVWLSR